MRSTILLVDDEKRFRESSQRLLTGRGYDVITAEDGQKALDFLLKNPVDLILLDLKMPVMGGEEFLQTMCPLYPDIPVVVITGHGTLDTAVNCMKKGAYDFITKPFDISQLLLSIERALEKRKLERRAKDYQEETVRNLLDLSTEKKRLETIISCMANGIMVTNKNLEVVLHNPALLRLLEVTAPVANPVPVHAIVKDQALIETLKKIQSGEPLENEFIAQEIRVGQRVLRAISAPTLEPERHVFWTVAGAVTVIEDITLFKQLDQMKSDFVNMVAHELRSPLVSIRQINSVLLEGLAGPLAEKQEDFVRRGMKKIDALLALINDLLDVARLEAGRLVQKQTAIDLSEVIEDMVLLMQLRAKEQGILLTHSCENMKPGGGGPQEHRRSPEQPFDQCDQLLSRGWKGHGDGEGSGPFRRDQGFRHWGGDRSPRVAEDLRQVLSGEASQDPPGHRNGAGAFHCQRHCGSVSRIDSRGKRSGSGNHFHRVAPRGSRRVRGAPLLIGSKY